MAVGNVNGDYEGIEQVNLQNMRKPIELQQQKGMTFYGIMFFCIFLGFIALVATKVAPHYIDDNNMTTMLESLDQKYKGKDVYDISDREIIRTLNKYFQVNRIPGLGKDAIDIKREKRDVLLIIDYERRENFIGNLYVVMHFVHEINLTD